jgi:alkylated DNA repair dioxygenase AlkB
MLPEGFSYTPEFLPRDDELALIGLIATVELAPVVMRGYEAKRRTAHFGVIYGYASWRVSPGPPMPEWLLLLRDRAAALAGRDPASFSEALISEYPPGAAIGWHRDAPQFGATVIGLSLGGRCRMRFRCTLPDGRIERAAQPLEPRSAYVMTGPARSEWQHSIPAVESLRHSITFRTMRRPMQEHST